MSMKLIGITIRTMAISPYRVCRGAYWNLRARFSFSRKNITKSPAAEDTIISVTSYPARIRSLYLTVQSLLWQKTSPTKICITLSTKEFPGGLQSLPKNLVKQVSQHSLIEIIWTEDNFRSYKKLMPVHEKYPELAIVTVDDDVIYPPNFMDCLLESSKRFPGAIVGTRGVYIGVRNRKVTPYSTWLEADEGKPSHRILLTGRGGILYPPNSLDALAYNVELADSICRDADDIWFKIMAYRAGTKNVKVRLVDELPSRARTQKASLYRHNVFERENDRKIEKLFNEFSIIPEELHSEE